MEIYSDYKRWIFEEIDKFKIIQSEVRSHDSYMTSFSVAANRRKRKQKDPPQDYYHQGNKSSYGKSAITVGKVPVTCHVIAKPDADTDLVLKKATDYTERQ
ncbi:hypothetical protein ABKV19_015937 [Rosa sericea]